MTFTGFSAIRGVSRWQVLLLASLTLGLFFGPLSNVDAMVGENAPMHHPHSHPSDDGTAGPPPADIPEHEHPAVQCGTLSCVPSFSGTLASTVPNVARGVLHNKYTSGGPLLRPLYLDSDPPVPRS